MSDTVESLLVAEQRTLQMIAGGASLAEVLDDLCRTIDAQAPDAISSVLLMDPDGKRLWPGAVSRVPSSFIQVIAPLTIGPRVGSCGTAAFLKERVIVSDIANDPLWAPFRDLALSHGFRAGWSQPIVSKDKQVLGTFGLYYAEPRVPTARELRLIEGAGHVALIAIETERTRAALQQALAEISKSEERLRLIVDTIPAQAWRALPDGSVDYFNQRWHDYTGLSPREAHGWGWKAIIHPEDAARAMGKWTQEVLPSGKPGEIEMRLRRFDGEYRWFIVRVEPQCDELGHVIQWYGTNTDIDDLKRAEDKLRRDEQELRRITDAIPQTIVVLGPDGTVIYANQSMLDYAGLTVEEVMATDFRVRVFHPEDVERLRDERQRALSRGIPFENEQRARRKDGQYRWFLIRYNPLFDEQGYLLRWYATGIDIQDRKQAEERMRNENQALRDEIDHSSMFEEIVGHSAPLRGVLAQVARVAGADATVLILGETGTGKELIARAIHRSSKRSSRAFIRVNCAAIPPSLIASELFGHEKGSFTGAVQRRIGRFEAADGGTIFLDEIGDLPPEAQVSLLRVLQEREFERVGSNRALPVDVRVLAASNRDLKSAVAQGKFREDLYYRLNVFPIEVPALRDRADDIPLLAEYLVRRFAQKAGKRLGGIDGRTLELLRAYDWPGNVRELQNVIERSVILSDGEAFSMDEAWLRRNANGAFGSTVSAPGVGGQLTSERIETALAASQGRVSGPSGAAVRLGIPRQTLESKIRALRINKHRFKTT
jgi:formate hydrogenlyase transcriptional activator